MTVSGRRKGATPPRRARPAPVAGDRVSSSTAGLTTDPQGRLELTGLPRGTYDWSLDVVGGHFEVLPGTKTRLELWIP